MTILGPLQLIIPFELYNCGDEKPANQEAEGQRPRRMAAVNADLKRQLNEVNEGDVTSRGECGKHSFCYIYLSFNWLTHNSLLLYNFLRFLRREHIFF